MLTWKYNYKPQEVLEREPDHVPRDLGCGPGSHCPPKGVRFNHFPGLKRSSPISKMGITSPAGNHSLADSWERSREREGRQQLGFRPCCVSCWGKRQSPRPESGSSDRFPSQTEGSTAHLGLQHPKGACQDLVSQESILGKSKTLWGRQS